MTSPRCRPGRCGPLAADDRGFAMVTAVILSALIVAVTGALVLSLTSGGRESARQRELYEARAAGVSALEYLYAELGADPDFFDGMLLETSPDTYDWIDLSSAAAPDTDTDGDWNQFGTGIAVETCSTRLDPCWEMRFAGNGMRTPQTVAVEAIVRFDCRGNGYCSVRRFQQQLRRANEVGRAYAWQRSDLTEVASGAALPVVVALSVSPGDATGFATSNVSIDGATISWTAPTDGDAPTGYNVQWKSGSQDYPTDTTDPRHQEVTAATYTFTGLTASTTYTVRVRAFNEGGRGDWVESSFTTVPNPPGSLRIVSTTKMTDDNDIELAWNAPTGGTAITTYLVEWGLTGEDTMTSAATSTTIDFTGLNDGTYTFEVKAQSDGGTSGASNTVNQIFP